MRQFIGRYIIEVACVVAVLAGIIATLIIAALPQQTGASLAGLGVTIGTFVAVVFGPLSHIRQD